MATLTKPRWSRHSLAPVNTNIDSGSKNQPRAGARLPATAIARSTYLFNRSALYSKGEMKMFYNNDQKNHLRNLIGLVLATAILMSMFAVTSYSATGSSSSIAKTNRATRPLTQSQTPALKANGKIAFVSWRDGNNEIYVMNPDGSNQTNLTKNSASDYEPAWSPDGAK